MKIVAILAFFLFSFFLFTTPIFAQEEASPSASPTPAPQTVNYDLPYPGMLPDNPLYFLKGIRDKIIEILISDPIKKAEFYLLSSDKRVNSGYFLIQKGKDDLGQEYISKSNNYMHMAITKAIETGEKGEILLGTMETAVKKHKEVIRKSLTLIDKKYNSNLQKEIERLDEFEALIKKNR